MWTKFDLGCYTLQEILEIIDDALCYLFEFKVENYSLYYREIVG